MDWQDDGILLSARLHGESAAILEVFTAAHGRHLGVLPGGASRSRAALRQPGTQLRLTWHARLDDHLGTWGAEILAQRAGILGDGRALNALSSAAALLHLGLPERQSHPRLYAVTLALFDALDAGTDWARTYLSWEMLLLEETGFGLDLSACAVTGATTDLAFVSPRSGRAVSRAGAGDWAPRLLPLPALMLGQVPADPGRLARELAQGLALTGHFLAEALAPQLADRPLPGARARLVRALSREGSQPEAT
jgi:DNA repair protein RecO (recombination protein O)